MKTTDDMADVTPYAALFLDIAAWRSDLRPHLTRCYLHLDKITKSRGVSFIMIDMPEACKVFDLGLSSGFFQWSRLPHTFGSAKRGYGTYFLGQLFLEVFGEDGLIQEATDPNLIFFIRQILLLAKKVKENCSDAAIETEVQAFKKTDEVLPDPTLDWVGDDPVLGRLDQVCFLDGYKSRPDLFDHRDTCPAPLLRCLQATCDIAVSYFPELDWRVLEPAHGPGAVADARTGTDKYLFPHWPRKLDHIFPFEYFAQSREDLHLEGSIIRVSHHEPPARLLAVPKTLKAPRLIASEPIAHMFLQKGIMRWIRANMPSFMRTSIDFLDQEKSRKAALAASASGLMATVDLSSASDRLSCWVVERIFRKHPSILSALHAARTRTVMNSTGHGERFFLKLKKFAAQGSAATFPTQTIAYWLMAVAACLYEAGRRPSLESIKRAARDIRVYGDDIIMPSHAVTSLVLLMSHLGLKVNMGKTHIKGHFRESCGMDAYMGCDVSPLYMQSLRLGSAAEDLVSWVDVSNNAHRKGLWHLSTWMADQIPVKIRNLVPISDETLGCVSLCSYSKGLTRGKTRVSPTLFRPEVLALASVSSNKLHRRDSYQSLLQNFVEGAFGDFEWWEWFYPLHQQKSGFLVRKRSNLRKRWVPYTKVR